MLSEERPHTEQVDAEEAFLRRVFRDFRETLWREKLWILGYCVVIVGATTLFVSQQKTYYRATTTLLIDSDMVQDPAEQKSLANLDLQTAVIRSPEVIDRVMEKANLLTDPVFADARNPREYFAEHLEVEPDKASKTIQISFQDTRPDVSAVIANQTAAAYIYQKTARSSGVSVDSIDSLKKQLAGEMEKLNALKTKIAELNKENPELGSEDIINDQIKFLNSQYIKTDGRVLEIRTTLAEFESLVTDGKAIEAHPYVANHPRVKSKLDMIRAAELDLIQLQQEYRGQHPSVLKAQSKLDALQKSLDSEKTQILAELRADLKANEATLKQLRENLLALQIKEKELSPQALTYKNLLAEEASITETVRLLNAKLSKISVDAGTKQSGIDVLSYATAPEEPYSPNKPRAMALALLFSVFTSFGFVFLRCYMDRALRKEEDIEQLIRKPFLGFVPAVRVQKGTMTPNFRNEKGRVYFANFLRLICANINFLVAGRERPTIMVTSAKPAEGKSFATYHLAHAFAQDGKRTILIDVDFLHSVTSLAFPNASDDQPGLHSFLMGEADMESIVEETAQPNLYLVRCHEAPFSAPHALRSERMRELVMGLKKHFDIILFDAPPVLALNDAVALGELVDMRIIVIEWGKTPRELVERAMKRIAPSNLVLAGIVLNRAKHWGETYYYDHYYPEKSRKPPYPPAK